MTQTGEVNYGEWIKYLSTIMVRSVNQAADVIADGAAEMSDGEHTVNSCFKTASKLADIALLNATEYAVTVLAGPGFTMVAADGFSDWYDCPQTQSAAQGISVSPNEPLSRNVSNDPIDTALISFEAQSASKVVSRCFDHVLPAGTVKFRIAVSRLGLHSGFYAGKVILTSLPPALPGNSIPVDVAIAL